MFVGVFRHRLLDFGKSVTGGTKASELRFRERRGSKIVDLRFAAAGSGSPEGGRGFPESGTK